MTESKQKFETIYRNRAGDNENRTKLKGFQKFKKEGPAKRLWEAEQICIGCDLLPDKHILVYEQNNLEWPQQSNQVFIFLCVLLVCCSVYTAFQRKFGAVFHLTVLCPSLCFSNVQQFFLYRSPQCKRCYLLHSEYLIQKPRFPAIARPSPNDQRLLMKHQSTILGYQSLLYLIKGIVGQQLSYNNMQNQFLECLKDSSIVS